MRPFNNGSTDDGSEASPGQVNWSLAKFSEIWCLNGRIWDIWSLNEKIWDIWCQAANIRDIRCHRGATCCTKTKYHSFTRKSLRLNRPFCQSGGRRLSKLISEMGGGGFNWGWQLGFGRFKGMFVWVGKAPLSSIIQPGVRLNCPKIRTSQINGALVKAKREVQMITTSNRGFKWFFEGFSLGQHQH